MADKTSNDGPASSSPTSALPDESEGAPVDSAVVEKNAAAEHTQQAQPEMLGQAVGDELRDPAHVLSGWRLHASMFGLALAMLIAAMESTIVATALATIGVAFNEYDKVGWVVTAYLLTFSAFILFWAKLVDIVGHRAVLLTVLLWFALFSGLCAASKSMSLTALIVFRALQGVGGAGINSTAFVTLTDICPARLLGVYSGVISSAFSIASVLGPVVGGAIASSGDWKWIFLFIAPAACLAAVIVSVTLPPSLKFHNGGGGLAASLRRVDVVGSVLSVASAIMLIYGLQNGGSAADGWADARIVGTITAGGVAVGLFFAYQWYLSRLQAAGRSRIEPILPPRVIHVRTCIVLMAAFFQGGAMYACIVNIPQINQIVHRDSPTAAGIKLLPFMLVLAFFTFVAGFTFSRTTRLAWHILAASALLSTLGVGLLIDLPFSDAVPKRMYGFQVIVGAGVGLGLPTFMVICRLVVEERDNAVIMGAQNTFRSMGGCIIIAISSAIFNSKLPEKLAFLPAGVRAQLQLAPTETLAHLGEEVADEVRRAYNDVYRMDFIAVTALSAVGVVTTMIPFFLPDRNKGLMVGSVPAASSGTIATVREAASVQAVEGMQPKSSSSKKT